MKYRIIRLFQSIPYSCRLQYRSDHSPNWVDLGDYKSLTTAMQALSDHKSKFNPEVLYEE